MTEFIMGIILLILACIQIILTIVWSKVLDKSMTKSLMGIAWYSYIFAIILGVLGVACIHGLS